MLTYNSEKDIFDCLTSVYQYNDIGEALRLLWWTTIVKIGVLLSCKSKRSFLVLLPLVIPQMEATDKEIM